MNEEQERLLRENNAMLKEITGYVRERRSAEYRDGEDMKHFCINVIADIIVDGMEENDKKNIRKNFNK